MSLVRVWFWGSVDEIIIGGDDGLGEKSVALIFAIGGKSGSREEIVGCWAASFFK